MSYSITRLVTFHCTNVDKSHFKNPHNMVLEHQKEVWGKSLHIFTDGSRDLSTGRAAFGFFVWEPKVGNLWRLPDQTSVFTAELFAILCALRWTEKKRSQSTVICSNYQRYSL